MCRAEAPHLDQLQKDHRKDGLIVLGINVHGDSADQIRRFAEPRDLEYRQLLRGDGVASRSYFCRAYPTLYWIDREGRIVARDYGMLGSGGLRKRARAIIGR